MTPLSASSTALMTRTGRPQGMSDYLRGNTVIRDNELNGHGRVSNDLANALVQANPSRFEAVPTSEYIKGIDY